MKSDWHILVMVMLLIGLILIPESGEAFAASFLTFDDLPVTEASKTPGNGGTWVYSSPHTNPSDVIGPTCGWYNTAHYPNNPNIFNYFKYYSAGYNNSHMGWETYGFLEIDKATAVHGNSLKVTVTGGMNSKGQHGARLYNKEKYLDLINSGNAPVGNDSKVGHPYIYFMNNGLSESPVPFPEAQGANRLSIYLKLPAEVSIGDGGWSHPPQNTFHIGTFNSGNGFHWYNVGQINGGGWTHILVDGHPQGNNAGTYPFPSKSLRDMGTDFFSNVYRFYITFLPYEGIATPPYHVWIDEIEFRYDPEPQNNETINTLAVTYHDESKTFEISFNDKYKDNQYSYSTYEIRYAFFPITNSNWNSAIPAHILANSRFGLSDNTQGRFEKWWPYYQAVWAPFKLRPEDEAKLTPGNVVYFAVKDVSQINGNGLDPVDSSYRGAKKGGRDYRNHGDTFDYEGDRNALLLIKRIDFQIPASDIGNNGYSILPPASVSAVPANSIDLSWSSVSGAVGYNVYRSTTSGSGYVKINGSSPVTGTSYVDKNTIPGTTYYYVVTSVNSKGQESAYSKEAHATEPNGNKAPTFTSLIVVPNPANNPHKKITFTINASDSDSDPLSYKINFGDGTSSSSGSTVTHAYNTKGTYNVTATVSDNHGHSVSKTLQVVVNDNKPVKVSGVHAK